ncbi:MAG: KEOPS complex subunit Cgi121 [Candidatus ainarchaeum sp.]|nr:KEOPS complex subunit Cgi121 [Candidatus ainarchaeum sp.]
MRVFRIGGGALLKEEGAVAIRAGMVESLEELQLAHYLAGRAFAEKTNVAKKMEFEFLLWLAGKTDIRSALESAAPKAGGDVLVVVFSERGGLVKKLEALGAKEAKLKKNAEPLALERISLSRI